MCWQTFDEWAQSQRWHHYLLFVRVWATTRVVCSNQLLIVARPTYLTLAANETINIKIGQMHIL
jgi:hypothetical protein